jgi:hypothetical protein
VPWLHEHVSLFEWVLIVLHVACQCCKLLLFGQGGTVAASAMPVGAQQSNAAKALLWKLLSGC